MLYLWSAKIKGSLLSRYYVISRLTVLLFFVSSINVLAEAGYKHAKKPFAQFGQEETREEVLNVGNKICPVFQEAIDILEEQITYEHEGKFYNFCSFVCIEHFKKDPPKYIKVVQKELAENK